MTVKLNVRVVVCAGALKIGDAVVAPFTPTVGPDVWPHAYDTMVAPPKSTCPRLQLSKSLLSQISFFYFIVGSLEGVVDFVVAVTEGFGINTDVGTDSDTGLNMDKEIETEAVTTMEMKPLFAAVFVGSVLG